MSESSGAETPPNQAVVAEKAPFVVEVEAGKKYWWCSCGRSSKQPFCDGAHKGTNFVPLEHTAEQTAKVYFCGCKATTRMPLCDGSHSKL